MRNKKNPIRHCDMPHSASQTHPHHWRLKKQERFSAHIQDNFNITNNDKNSRASLVDGNSEHVTHWKQANTQDCKKQQIQLESSRIQIMFDYTLGRTWGHFERLETVENFLPKRGANLRYLRDWTRSRLDSRVASPSLRALFGYLLFDLNRVWSETLNVVRIQ